MAIEHQKSQSIKGGEVAQPTRGQRAAAKYLAEKAAAKKAKAQFTIKQIFESLFYELKPFVLALGGIALTIYFTEHGQSAGKFFAFTLAVSGVVILYSRAKARGIIH